MIALLDCGHPPTPTDGCGTGYGQDEHGKRHCYQCCAERDMEAMRQDGRAVLYLVADERQNLSEPLGGPLPAGHSGRMGFYGKHRVTNWPGSLSIPVHYVRRGYHNWAGCRFDFWFTFEGHVWHGVQYGNNTQIAHCRRTKEVA